MKVGISSHTYDLAGAFILDASIEDSDLFSMNRRVSRTETLDGGVDVSDFGFSHGDRTVTLVSEIENEDTINSLQAFFQTYSNVVLSLRNGVYDAYMSDFKNDFGRVSMVFLIYEELS